VTNQKILNADFSEKVLNFQKMSNQQKFYVWK